MWSEFKPAIRFVLLFVGLYFVGNLIYGFYISMNSNLADGITKTVANQSAWLLSNILDYDVVATPSLKGPTVYLKTGEYNVLNVFEGCNGINVFIVFVAFVVAFNGSPRRQLWFVPLGILILYVCNLMRIVFLYWTAIHFHRYFYYVHKYIFTGFIYVVVFLLWIAWVYQFNDRKKIITTE
jgi:exosortase family protein XrtF